MSTIEGNDRSGGFGRVAVTIAKFPRLVKEVFKELTEKDTALTIPRLDADLSEFTKVNSSIDNNIDGLLMRLDNNELSNALGWRIVVGVFEIDGQLKNAALALSPNFEVSNIWILDEGEISGEEPRDPFKKFIHGFAILKDGSVIFSYDGGVSLQRIDQCGSRIWAIAGHFSHSVSLDSNEEFIWTILDSKENDYETRLVKVAADSGEIVKVISMEDIITANPLIDILEIRKQDYNDSSGNSRNTDESWLHDPYHLNDVEPLPKNLVSSFEGFKEGDLLVSSRSLNLIFVIDPESLQIKWWLYGATRRQHDPDWGAKGEFIVYDNRMGRDYSQIVSISPKSYKAEVFFDGRANNFYSRIRGKQQIAKTGNLLVTSPQQGRFFEVNTDGKVVLELINTVPESERLNYVISEVIWLPKNTFSYPLEGLCVN
ncbi:MAG: arylsulfotransferase family protein [Sedimenticola sp.]